MEDAAIVELYWQRAPEAIGHTQEKYGAYCLAIAGRLVPVREDAEEVCERHLAARVERHAHGAAMLSGAVSGAHYAQPCAG